MNPATLHSRLFPRKFWPEKFHESSGENDLDFRDFLHFRIYFGMYSAGRIYQGGGESIVTRLPATFRPYCFWQQLPKTTLSPLMGARVWSSVSNRGGQTETIDRRRYN